MIDSEIDFCVPDDAQSSTLFVLLDICLGYTNETKSTSNYGLAIKFTFIPLGFHLLVKSVV